MMTLHIDPKDFQKALAPLKKMPTEVRGALWQAVKRSLDTMKKELSIVIKRNSFLAPSLINRAISKPQMYGTYRRGNTKITSNTIMGAVRVASKQLPLDKFKLVPNRITARKGHSRAWPAAGFQIGPRSPVRFRDKRNGLSKGFVLRGAKGLQFYQSVLSSRRRYAVPKKTKRKYPEQGYMGYTLRRATGYNVQYFAAFDNTLPSIQPKVKARFEAVLAHEVKYRLSKIGGRV